MDMKRLQELAGIPKTELFESIDDILLEAFSIKSLNNNEVNNLYSTYLGKQSNIETFIKDFKKVLDNTSDTKDPDFIKNLIPECKRFLQQITDKEFNRALNGKIENDPKRGVSIGVSSAEAFFALKEIFRKKIQPLLRKESISIYIPEDDSKTDAAKDLGSPSPGTIYKFYFGKIKNVNSKTGTPPPSKTGSTSSDEETRYQEVEEIFKRTVKQEGPGYNKVKIRDKVLEEYINKIMTTYVILGNFSKAGDAVKDNLKETFPGKSHVDLEKDIDDLQTRITDFEKFLKTKITKIAEDYSDENLK